MRVPDGAATLRSSHTTPLTLWVGVWIGNPRLGVLQSTLP